MLMRMTTKEKERMKVERRVTDAWTLKVLWLTLVNKYGDVEAQALLDLVGGAEGLACFSNRAPLS